MVQLACTVIQLANLSTVGGQLATAKALVVLATVHPGCYITVVWLLNGYADCTFFN